MWNGSSVSYGKEPFDLRLTVLRMIRNLHIIIGFTVAATVILVGLYYIMNTVLNRDIVYTVTSTYKLSYVHKPVNMGDYHITTPTWNTYVSSKEFLDAVLGHMQEDAPELATQLTSSEELSTMFEIRLETDMYMPSTVATTDSEEWTIAVAQAVEKALTQEFVEGNDQVEWIRVIDPAITAEAVGPDLRPVRALVLSAILSFFSVVVVLLLRELGDNSIWLPVTLGRRYGFPAVGTVNSPELTTNLEYLFADHEKIAVCAVDDQVNPVEALKILQEKTAEDTSLKQAGDMLTGEKRKEWIPVPAPMLCPEACEAMRQSDGVLLVVRAGLQVGKPLEYVLEFLATQNIKVTAALLWDADEWLIRAYYVGKVSR